MKKALFLASMIMVLVLCISVAMAADVKVIVEGESFISETGGTLKTAPGRPESSNKNCILNWNNKGHVVEWEVNIPEDGFYKMVLRYANGRDWKTYRQIKIDGQIPNSAFAKITLEPTGGFCKEINDWRNLTVTGKDNQPAMIELTEGLHTVTIINLGGDDNNDGATNLDSFGFLSKSANPGVLGKEKAK